MITLADFIGMHAAIRRQFTSSVIYGVVMTILVLATFFGSKNPVALVWMFVNVLAIGASFALAYVTYLDKYQY